MTRRARSVDRGQRRQAPPGSRGEKPAGAATPPRPPAGPCGRSATRRRARRRLPGSRASAAVPSTAGLARADLVDRRAGSRSHSASVVSPTLGPRRVDQLEQRGAAEQIEVVRVGVALEKRRAVTSGAGPAAGQPIEPALVPALRVLRTIDALKQARVHDHERRRTPATRATGHNGDSIARARTPSTAGPRRRTASSEPAVRNQRGDVRSSAAIRSRRPARRAAYSALGRWSVVGGRWSQRGGHARLRLAAGLATAAFAGVFFFALTASRLFRSASIRLTTFGGASTAGATISSPAIFASMIRCSPSRYSSL